jgi:hypothetical protein
MGIELPDWGQYLINVGRQLSQIPPVEYGEMAPRVVLSVPTGRFTYWLLTAGALLDSPKLENDCGIGDVVATWDDKRMRDSTISDGGNDRWKLDSGLSVIAGDWPAVKLPEGTPEDRRAARVDKDYRDVLAKLPGKRHNWHKWFAEHCLKPVAIVGTGREHIQRQRETLLRDTPGWFSQETYALLNEDSSATSNPQRMLFHPYMVFDAAVGQERPWLRQMLPRLVIITSWSSRNRIHQSMFSRVPHVIVTNRRVRSSIDVDQDLQGFEDLIDLDQIINKGRPSSIQVRAFSEIAQGESSDDLEEDWFI